jgi:molecular chaperone GrpE (heat shock protein)
MSNIYCGSKKEVPKGKVRGSMVQCAERGEIRFFGINKIDQVTADKYLEKRKAKRGEATKLKAEATKLKKEKEELQESYVKNVGKLKNLKSKIEFEKDKKQKKVLEKELTILLKTKDDINTKLKKFNSYL